MARTSAKAKKLKQTGNNSNKTQKVEETASENKLKEVKSIDNADAGDSTDKENDDVNYEVEKIVHTRVYRGKRQYLIRWKGYGEDSDTWENESTLQACPEALETFKNENSSLVDKSKGDSDNDGDDEETEDTQEEETKTKNKTVKVSKKVKSKMQNLKKTKKTTNESDEEDNELDDNAQMEVDNEEKESKDLKKATLASKKNKGRRQKEKDEPSSKKPKSNDSDDESVTDGKNYEVEKILEVHTRKDKTREFLIRWKGYKPSEDTWEPEAHLDCQDLIEKFMEKVDKAKSIPARELREARAPAHKFVSHARSARGVNLRNSGVRPCYQE